MGFGDSFKSLVLTEYKADTKQMRGELKKLSKEQQAQAKLAIEAGEKQNKAIDDQIAMLGKAVIAIGAVTAAYKLAEVGLEAYEKRSRLSAATVGVNLNGLQKATQGLVSETRLLEFASKAMNGTFKLSQTEMEQAVTGALALRKTLGVDLTKALEVTQKAITEGTTEPLKELGLVVKGVENDTREGLMAALGELSEQARLAGPNLRIPGDEMAEAQVKMTDAVDDLKISLGELAQNLAPVIAKMARLVGLMTDAAKAAASFWLDGPEHISGGVSGAVEWAKKQKQLKEAAANELRRNGASSLVGTAYDAPTFGADFGSSMNGSGFGKGKSGARKRKGSGGFSLNALEIGEGIDVQTGMKLSTRGMSFGDAGAFRGQTADAASGATEAMQIALEVAASIEQLQQKNQQNMLASIFGTPAEIDQTALALESLTMGFDGLSNAFGAGVDALITGSDSFAHAFKTAIGESLRSMAVEMSISALKHTAYGLASMAFLDGRGAAAHFAAAGQFGLGAVAAGAGARLLGAGAPQVAAGRTAGPTAASAGVGSASTAPGKDSGNTQVFILGDDFGSLSSRERESRFREISRSAGFTIEGDVVQNG